MKTRSVGLVLLTLVVLGLARAVHPPAGAVAMTAALSPEAAHALGFGFALAPVGLGTVLLVMMAAAYARAGQQAVGGYWAVLEGMIPDDERDQLGLLGN